MRHYLSIGTRSEAGNVLEQHEGGEGVARHGVHYTARSCLRSYWQLMTETFNCFPAVADVYHRRSDTPSARPPFGRRNQLEKGRD